MRARLLRRRSGRGAVPRQPSRAAAADVQVVCGVGCSDGISSAIGPACCPDETRPVAGPAGCPDEIGPVAGPAS